MLHCATYRLPIIDDDPIPRPEYSVQRCISKYIIRLAIRNLHSSIVVQRLSAIMERVRRLSGAFLHAVGNVFSEPHPLTDVSLNPAQADALIKYQRHLPHPMYLGERAFFVAEIVDTENSSVEVQKALIKHDIILEAPTTSAPGLLAPRHSMEDEIPVKTAAITKNFPHQLASTGLSISSQKLVVALLCFWFEEWKRWSRLEREERDLTEQIEVARRVDNTRAIGFFSSELGKVQRKKRLLWSEREENREIVGSSSNVRGPSGMRDREESLTTDAASDQLPSYGDSTNSIQIATGGAARVRSGGVDELPSYGDWTSERGANGDDGVAQSHDHGAIEESQSQSTDDVNKLPSQQSS
ncbi:hypothetical protein OCU04_006101 [Sclerotinia nivalis]|uniref:Uncharacterized protein n=1 Tax=Sclerotinia nivalis TaxID=352851 RepID=A0A9X0AQS4_9HELO|nr:hypothetical protein OCU04_006101 [Sclerotinia nivalis]